MSTPLPELKKLLGNLLRDSCKLNIGNGFVLASLELIDRVPLSKLSSVANYRVETIQALGVKMISLISSYPTLFSVGLAVGVTVGVGVAIYCSLSKEQRSKINSKVSDCFKNVCGSLKSCWEKAWYTVSSFFSKNKIEISQNETINVTNHIVSKEAEIPDFNKPVLNGIDFQMLENKIIEHAIEVPPLFFRSLINTTIEIVNNSYIFRLTNKLIVPGQEIATYFFLFYQHIVAILNPIE
ncbi:hypothetical protein ACTFIZ_008315 [Dictyostelium cf. discoideum]